MEAVPKSDIKSVIKSDIRFDISIKQTTWIGHKSPELKVFGKNQIRISPSVSKKSYRDYVGTKIRKSFLPFLAENIEMSIHAFFLKKKRESFGRNH